MALLFVLVLTVNQVDEENIEDNLQVLPIKFLPEQVETPILLLVLEAQGIEK